MQIHSSNPVRDVTVVMLLLQAGSLGEAHPAGGGRGNLPLWGSLRLLLQRGNAALIYLDHTTFSIINQNHIE